MSSETTLESAKKAVFFPFQGERWGLKLLIGSALSLAYFLVPILPDIILQGYFGQIGKRVIVEDGDPELPEWIDWGAFFSDGIKLVGAGLLYILPGLLSMLLGTIVMFGSNFAFLLDPRFETNPDAVLPAYFMGSMAGMAAGMALIMIGMVLAAIAGLFLLPAQGHLLATGQFGAAFRAGEWWPIFTKNIGGYLLAWLIMSGMTMVLYYAVYTFYYTVILCWLMPFVAIVAGFLLGAIRISLLAVAYRDGKRKLDGAAS